MEAPKTLKGRGLIPVGPIESGGPALVPAAGYGQFAVTARGEGRDRRWYVWHLGTMLIAGGRMRLKRDAVRLAKLLDRMDFSRVTKTPWGRVLDLGGVMDGIGRAVCEAREGDWEEIETLVRRRERGKAINDNG